MIKAKQKPCKGTGRAKGYGCKKLAYKRTYGLCDDCFKEWLYSTPEGLEVIKKYSIRAKKKVDKDLKPTKAYIKWQDKDLKDMVQYVQFNIVNPYIVARDKMKFGRCISSNLSISDAGHLYAVSKEPRLRFNIMNIHGQSVRDNRFQDGEFLKYEQGIINRYGIDYLRKIKRIRAESIEWPKLDRIELIRIGKTYKYLHKHKIWCMAHEEFENYKDIINK